jgi:hypothetical protein
MTSQTDATDLPRWTEEQSASLRTGRFAERPGDGRR